MLKVVVAPNAFKGSLSAPKAAAAIARGVRQVLPAAEIVEVPVADGGDGTVEALVTARRGVLRSAEVEGPLGEPVNATYGLIQGGAPGAGFVRPGALRGDVPPQSDGRTAVVELASASGLALLAPDQRNPRVASTYGFGQLLDAVRVAGVNAVIAGIGGSATNDGGAGMAQALGYRLLDAQGRDLPRGGAALSALERIDGSGLHPGWRSVEVTVACDVTNPLIGAEGASLVFGPQKGADPDTVRELDAALARLAQVIERDLGKRVADIPGAGAAGGTGAGLIAFLDAELVPGAPLVVGAAGLDRALEGAQLAITGEGRADSQTAFGKAPGEVARRARAAGVPTLLLAGSKGPGWERLSEIGVTEVRTLDEEGENPEQLMRDAASALTRAAARALRGRIWG